MNSIDTDQPRLASLLQGPTPGPLRITFLCPGYVWTPGGGYRVIYEYANHLARRGHVVSVVHPRHLKYAPPMRATSVRSWVRLKVHMLRNRLFRPSVVWQQIDPRVKMLYVPNSDARFFPDADAIFATTWQTIPSVQRCPASKGEQFILVQGHELSRRHQELADEKTWRSPMHRVVVSKWLLELGRSLGGSDMIHIPNAIDQARYQLKRPVEDRALQVVMLFSDVPVKGAADGIAALQIVKEKFPGLKALLFGVGPRRSWIPEWIEYHRNPSQEFIVDSAYNGSRVILSPSLSEGFALPPAEAAACGCAVVATDSGGIRDYIEAECTGLLSPPGDPVALAKNLCRALSDDALRLRLVEACRVKVRELSWERSAALMEGYISEVARKD